MFDPDRFFYMKSLKAGCHVEDFSKLLFGAYFDGFFAYIYSLSRVQLQMQILSIANTYKQRGCSTFIMLQLHFLRLFYRISRVPTIRVLTDL